MRITLGAACTALALSVSLLGITNVQAQLAEETAGHAVLPFPPEPHRSYVNVIEFDNLVVSRVVVIDPDAKRMLGMLSTGGAAPIVLAHDGKTIYSADTFYSRYTRGTRTDVLTAWDSSTLAPSWEVEIPAKRASTLTERFSLGLSSDDRLAYIYNLTPSTSVTVVDTQTRKVLSEIATPGCILSYPVGKRGFASLCGNGKLQVVTLNEDGKEKSRTQTPFFSPNEDPLVERAAVSGETYYFVTTSGVVHAVDLSGATPKVLPTWSLVDEQEKKSGWAPGGLQSIAVAPALDRFYVMMHPDHKPLNWQDPSQTIWVYDLKTQKKIGVLESPNPVWSVHATTDQSPLLLGTNIAGGIEVFDLNSGKHTGTMDNVAKTATLILSH
ncbi:amine dehydrogenase [Pseudomonas sp. GD03860]|uniref:amine dehydrogenase large subunit n=1 Tax=Pseudomonas TaxID=286 RepID=UPI00236436EA|nr:MULTISPECIES: amine dehydrogenase large subunit [Pseudomonas]MDD2058466.1 amine dehydrogenase [Pseudomonas putida]MDH0640433.1 amine dehydrogenase [Pseudomonas sp. GD03860]